MSLSRKSIERLEKFLESTKRKMRERLFNEPWDICSEGVRQSPSLERVNHGLEDFYLDEMSYHPSRFSEEDMHSRNISRINNKVCGVILTNGKQLEKDQKKREELRSKKAEIINESRSATFLEVFK